MVGNIFVSKSLTDIAPEALWTQEPPPAFASETYDRAEASFQTGCSTPSLAAPLPRQSAVRTLHKVEAQECSEKRPDRDTKALQ